MQCSRGVIRKGKVSVSSSKLTAAIIWHWNNKASSRGWGLREGHLLCVWKVTASHRTLEDRAMRFQFLGMSEEPSVRNTNRGIPHGRQRGKRRRWVQLFEGCKNSRTCMDCNSSVSRALSCGNYFLVSSLSKSEIRACFLGQGSGLFFSA